MKKEYRVIGVIFLIVILLVPVAVSYLMECSLMDIGTQKSESWMSFWGGYLGAILGIAGAITATTIQIKSQTNQIVVAAKENDRLERVRIELNLKIEKNIELFKYYIELKRNQIYYDVTLKYLLQEQSFLLKGFENESQAKRLDRSDYDHFTGDVKPDVLEKIKKVDEENQSRFEKIKMIKNELKQTIASVESLITNVLSNIIFVNEEEQYYKLLKGYLIEIQSEVEEVEKYILPIDIITASGLEFLTQEKIEKRSSRLNQKISKLKKMETEISESYSTFMEKMVNAIGKNE